MEGEPRVGLSSASQNGGGSAPKKRRRREISCKKRSEKGGGEFWGRGANRIKPKKREGGGKNRARRASRPPSDSANATYAEALIVHRIRTSRWSTGTVEEKLK